MNKRQKVSYIQKFRAEWKTNPALKDWIEESEDKTVAKCKFCKCNINARFADLNTHSLSKKHCKSAEPFSSARQQKLPFKSVSNESILRTANIEAHLSLFVANHCAIRCVDHLTDLTKLCFKGIETADRLKLHRTKCSGIIKHILYPYFTEELKTDIGESMYGLLLDETTDIGVLKQLGICIIYYSETKNSIVTTLLTLVELDAGSAVHIVEALKKSLTIYNLDITKLRGIGSDNASVMTGKNNGVYAILKRELDHLVLIRCVCHSVQLAVSAAASTSLPDHLEFLLSETYNWFAHSTTRQLNYKILYNTLNNGIEPLKIVRVSSTRWLSIEVAVSRILDQWNDLRDHFSLVGSNDHCYKAKTLYNMFKDKNNLLYFTFLKPILGEAQHILIKCSNQILLIAQNC